MLTYAVAIFLSAFLLFQVQPMIAKYILPWFGGTAAVWTTCLLFFQLLLLAGYGYSHFVGSRLRPRGQALVHAAAILACVIVMLALSFIWSTPITPGPEWKPQNAEFPIVKILALLFVSIGFPYFILSTTGPLLQAWFARSQPGTSPYRLYSLSNLGSLIALVAYPFVVEPALNLTTQALIWSALFICFSISIWICARQIRRAAEPDTPAKSPDESAKILPEEISAVQYALWISLAACGSVMLLATTNQISQEVAPVPFLWILPLVLYLLSFIICFDNEQWYRREIFHSLFAVAVVGSCATVYLPNASIGVQIITFSLLLFSACMVCHGELVRLRPAAEHLTAFYLMVAVGGALGGIFVAAIAPHIFSGYWEFYIGVWACAALLFVVLLRDPESWIHRDTIGLVLAVFGCALALPLLLSLSQLHDRMLSWRNAEYVIAGLAMLTIVAITARRGQPAGKSNRRPGRMIQLGVALSLVMLGVLSISAVTSSVGRRIVAERNFYGTLAVVSRDDIDANNHAYLLYHGQILHGLQFTSPDKRNVPTAYYGRDSGIDLLIRGFLRRSASDGSASGLRVGVVGLGVGTLAAYGRAGDFYCFYEINPEVIDLAAAKSGFFTYLRDSKARELIVPGDARLSMEHEIARGEPRNFDVLVIDAFSGDSIPVHLLTREAFEIYWRELKPNGVLAIHISNRYLDLRPVLRSLAVNFGLHFVWVHASTKDQLRRENDWVLLARDDGILGQDEIAKNSTPFQAQASLPLWTDDRTSLFQILK